MVFLKEFFRKIDFEKIQQTTKQHAIIPSMHRVKECDRLGVPIDGGFSVIDGGFSVISRQTPTNPRHDAVCNLRTCSLVKFISFSINPSPATHLLRKKCHLLKLSAVCKYLCQGLISAYRQTIWTQIRLLQEEQSDLVPHCLLQTRLQ